MAALPIILGAIAIYIVINRELNEIKVTYGDTLTNGTYIVSAPELGLTSVDVKNSKTVLPQTGGNGNIIAYSIAFILLAAGGTVFFISRRKKKSRDKAA